MKNTNKISVTIITGFLGAGKTTFINQLLQNYSDTQFALVENEFGDVAIDTQLIKGVEASQMFELKQGCICCTISDEFELVLQELAERFPNVEHLLIETTGIADPGAVIRPFFVDENLKEIYQYKGTICLVDAIHFENSPEKEITLKQLVLADLVLISKSEKLSNRHKEDFKNEIQKINPFATVDFISRFKMLETKDNSFVKLNSLLHKKKSEFDFVGLSGSHSGLSSKTLRYHQKLNKTEFLNCLEYTLDIHKQKIYRTKGILFFENEVYETILQGVGGSFEISEGELIFGETASQLVFIGKLEGLDLEF